MRNEVFIGDVSNFFSNDPQEFLSRLDCLKRQNFLGKALYHNQLNQFLKGEKS